MMEKGRHDYVLERGCLQYEPNDPEYFKVEESVCLHLSRWLMCNKCIVITYGLSLTLNFSETVNQILLKFDR